MRQKTGASRKPRWGLVLLCAAAVIWCCQIPEASQRTSEAPIILKARNWLGPETARAAIRTIEVKGTETLSSGPVYAYHFKMLWPDKHLMDYPGGYTFVVNGQDSWSNPPVPPTAVPLSPERNRYDLNLHAIEFLLAPPPGSGITMTSKGRGTEEGMSGELVSVNGPGPVTLMLVIDPTDGHLIGYTRPRKLVGATRGPSEGTQVVHLADYRKVNGVKFPFKIVRESFGVTNVLVVDSMRINEGVSAADFVRR